MPLRTRIFILVTVVVLMILAISLFLFTFFKGSKPENNQTVDSTTIESTTDLYDTGTSDIQILGQDGQIVQISNVVVEPMSQEQIEKNAAEKLARIFIERYGSYSNQNEQQNIKEVEVLSTKDLWAEISKKIGGESGTKYVGVVTKVVTSKITLWQEISATVELYAMREVEENNKVQTSQQAVVVYMVKTDGQWLVDDFKWQ
ncbi:MAG: hypothetical protein ABIH87_01040 [bacterium]